MFKITISIVVLVLMQFSNEALAAKNLWSFLEEESEAYKAKEALYQTWEKEGSVLSSTKGNDYGEFEIYNTKSKDKIRHKFKYVLITQSDKLWNRKLTGPQYKWTITPYKQGNPIEGETAEFLDNREGQTAAAKHLGNFFSNSWRDGVRNPIVKGANAIKKIIRPDREGNTIDDSVFSLAIPEMGKAQTWREMRARYVIETGSQDLESDKKAPKIKCDPNQKNTKLQECTFEYHYRGYTVGKYESGSVKFDVATNKNGGYENVEAVARGIERKIGDQLKKVSGEVVDSKIINYTIISALNNKSIKTADNERSKKPRAPGLFTKKNVKCEWREKFQYSRNNSSKDYIDHAFAGDPVSFQSKLCAKDFPRAERKICFGKIGCSYIPSAAENKANIEPKLRISYVSCVLPIFNQNCKDINLHDCILKNFKTLKPFKRPSNESRKVDATHRTLDQVINTLNHELIL